MIEVIAYKPGHLDLIDLAEVHSDDDRTIQDYQEGNVSMHLGFTIIDRESNQVLGVMNAILIHKSCLEVCMIVGKQATGRPIGFYRAVRRTLDHYAKSLGVRRVQATIRCNYPHLLRWIQMLGFSYEGRLRKFGVSGDDYMMFSRIV